MQTRKNCHRHIWLLAGTGEGPYIAMALIRQGWTVSVSVVTSKASTAYQNLPLENVWIGCLSGVEGIEEIIHHSRFLQKPFEWVVDATHPFAEVISQQLHIACQSLKQPLVRFDRPTSNFYDACLLRDISDLPSEKLNGKNVLIALGSRSLNKASFLLREAGARVFARVLPSPESIRMALASSIPPNHLAILHPRQLFWNGELEEALCKRWSIDLVICRQSGGTIQNLWESVCFKNDLRLLMIMRPCFTYNTNVVNNVKELIEFCN